MPASSRPGSVTVSARAAELADLGALDAAAGGQHQRLHAVADAQHRDPELEQRRVEPRRALGVDGGRAAREDQPLRAALAHLVDADVVRQQLGEDPELAHPPGDQLGVLAAVVEDDDLVRGHLALERQLVDAAARRRWCRGPPSDADRPTPSPPAPSRPPRAPMPTAWSRWSCLPSLCSAGAIISSARLNSAMSR